MQRNNITPLRIGIMLAATLAAGCAACANTITVVNLSQNGPSDMVDSGTTAATLFITPPDQSALAGNNSCSQFFNAVTRLDFNVRREHVAVFVGNNGGEGACSSQDTQAGELQQVSDDQVYVAEVVCQGNEAGESTGAPIFTPEASFETHVIGSSFGSMMPGGSISATPSMSPPGGNPVPEPAALPLLALLVGLGVRRRCALSRGSIRHCPMGITS